MNYCICLKKISFGNQKLRICYKRKNRTLARIKIKASIWLLLARILGYRRVVSFSIFLPIKYPATAPSKAPEARVITLFPEAK